MDEAVQESKLLQQMNALIVAHNESMDEAVEEAKLLLQVNALIVAHLRGQRLGQAAAAVAAAAVAALSAADSVPSNHLLRLVAKVPPPSPSSCLGFSSAPA